MIDTDYTMFFSSGFWPGWNGQTSGDIDTQVRVDITATETTIN
jgi:hypothetical protein